MQATPVHGRANLASIGGTDGHREGAGSAYLLDGRRPTHRKRIETYLASDLHELGYGQIMLRRYVRRLLRLRGAAEDRVDLARRKLPRLAHALEPL